MESERNILQQAVDPNKDDTRTVQSYLEHILSTYVCVGNLLTSVEYAKPKRRLSDSVHSSGWDPTASPIIKLAIADAATKPTPCAIENSPEARGSVGLLT